MTRRPLKLVVLGAVTMLAAALVVGLGIQLALQPEDHSDVDQTIRADPMARYQPPLASRQVEHLSTPAGGTGTDRAVAREMRRFAVPEDRAREAYRAAIATAREAGWRPIEVAPVKASGELWHAHAGKTTIPGRSFDLDLSVDRPSKGQHDATLVVLLSSK